MKRSTSPNFTIILAISDMAALTSALCISYYLRNYGIFRNYLFEIQPFSVYLFALPFALFLLLGLFKTLRLFEWEKRIYLDSYIWLILKGIGAWLLFVMAGSYLYKYDYSRILVLSTFLWTVILMGIERIFLWKYERRLLEKGKGVRNILIVGAGRPGREIARKLNDIDSARFNIIGFVDDNSNGSPQYPLIGSLANIRKLIKAKKIDEVYISDPNLSHDTILELMSKCLGLSAILKIESTVFELISGSLESKNLSDLPVIDLNNKTTLHYKLLKDILDRILSGLLLIFTTPCLFVISLIIKMEDKGPIIIKQKRVGENGKLFTLFKFRTMKRDTALYATAPSTEKDKRITHIGKFLRKYSLDELPQLVNILKGEMSFVGPRPEMPQVVRKYSPWQKKRLLTKPGLTGLWQVLGRKDLPLTYNLEYDFYYIANKSLALDLHILVKTVITVISAKGAY